MREKGFEPLQALSQQLTRVVKGGTLKLEAAPFDRSGIPACKSEIKTLYKTFQKEMALINFSYRDKFIYLVY